MADYLSHATRKPADRRKDMTRKWIDTAVATVIVTIAMTSTTYSIVFHIPA